MFYPRQTVAEINLQALASNYAQIKSLLKPTTKILAAVKANAYGHGAVRIAQELEKLGVDMFGVSCIYEISELRNAGIKTPILNMAATCADDVAAVFQYNYTPSIFSLDIAQKISQMAVQLNKIVNIHIKVETGMSRLGVEYSEVAELITAIKKLPHINIEGLFTHFSDAENLDSGVTEMQLQKFQNVLDQLKKLQIKIPLVHVSKTAGILFWPQAEFDMVRPGIGLYGYSPNAAQKLPIKLRPILALRTRVSWVKTVPANTPVSYNCTFHTQKESSIITLPIGYGDGFRRTPHNWGEVIVGGKKVPVVGRVCMDQSMVDGSEAKGVKIDDEVVIIGKQGDEEINCWQVANHAKTSIYEVLTGISARVTRVYF